MYQDSSGEREDFSQLAGGFILNGDRDALKRLYASLTARACIKDEQAASDMRRALHEELSRISSRVKRDVFADL